MSLKKTYPHYYKVLSSRQLLFSLIPETSSRVTLAMLGIGFQPNHIVGCR